MDRGPSLDMERWNELTPATHRQTPWRRYTHGHTIFGWIFFSNRWIFGKVTSMNVTVSCTFFVFSSVSASAWDNQALGCNFADYSLILKKFSLTLSTKPSLIWLWTTPSHLKYVATLSCNLLLMACFADTQFLTADIKKIFRLVVQPVKMLQLL